MKYEIYLDVFWLTNFFMDFIILLLVRFFRRKKGRFWRYLISAGFAATASLILFLKLRSFTQYQLITHFVVNPIMIFLGFGCKNLRGLVKDFLYAYGVTLLLGGIMNWGMENLGLWKYFYLWAIAGVGICMLLFHWFVNRKEEELAYEILLITKHRKIKALGYLDTGNLLFDPIMHQPVHIIEEKLLEHTIEEEKLPVRYIPYHSLGQEQGLLQVVTLKAMYMKGCKEKENGAPVYIEKPVFGLAKEKLFQEKKYQIILNAKCNQA